MLFKKVIHSFFTITHFDVFLNFVVWFSFELTNPAQRHGCGCKKPQPLLDSGELRAL